MGKISCYFCSKKCRGDVLKVENKYFHKECFTCKVCHQKLENIPFFFKDNGFYCTQDYTEFCASQCLFCQKKIIGEVVTALNHTFHKSCFNCTKCHRPFIAGDRVSMRNKYDFFCASCSDTSNIINNRANENVNYYTTYHSNKTKPSAELSNGADTTTDQYQDAVFNTYDGQGERRIQGNNQIELAESFNTDIDSASVPIRRKQMGVNGGDFRTSTATRNNNVTSSNNVRRPFSTSNAKRPTNGNEIAHPPTIKWSASENSTTPQGNTTSNSGLPRHFHVPQGNTRTWMFNPSVVGTKNHPLALSTSHLERQLPNQNDLSLKSPTSHQQSDGPVDSSLDVKRLASYPNGNADSEEDLAPIEREDFPAPPAINIMLTEKNRRKIQNPTVEALSAGTTPRIRKTRSSPQHRNTIPSANNGHMVSNKVPITNEQLEILKRSSTDYYTPKSVNNKYRMGATDYHSINSHVHPHSRGGSSSRHTSDQSPHNLPTVPHNPISASRCPSASCEPLIPPRYPIHTETSPSRNDDYFKTPDRHLGYSMEYVNSTSRTFLADTVPGARHSFHPRSITNDVSGLKKVRQAHSTRTLKNVGFYPSTENVRNNSNQSINLTGIEFNENSEFVPYERLRISVSRKMKQLDRTRLESYLCDEEFEQLFHISRQSFYRLPEWKRNDLKKRVELF